MWFQTIQNRKREPQRRGGGGAVSERGTDWSEEAERDRQAPQGRGHLLPRQTDPRRER